MTLIHSAGCSDSVSADLVLIPERIFTASSSEPWVDALAVTGERLHQATRGRRVAVKSLLLDQSIIAGVDHGGLYGGLTGGVGRYVIEMSRYN